MHTRDALCSKRHAYSRRRSVFAAGLLVPALIALSACSFLARDDDSVFATANDYFKAHEVQVTVQADPSQLPLQVNYAMHRKPVLQQPLTVDFEFVPQRDSRYVGVGIRVSEGLDWLGGARQFSYQDVKKFQVLKHQLRIKPLEEGHFSIDVVVVMEVEGERRAKSLQIPLSLGVNQQPEE